METETAKLGAYRLRGLKECADYTGIRHGRVRRSGIIDSSYYIQGARK